MKENILLIVAGGTGGHIFPGLAIAREFIRLNIKVEWAGNKNNMEYKIVSGHNINFHHIPIKGFRGTSFFFKLKYMLKLVIAVFRSIYLVYRTKPKVVLAMGGYLSVPCGIAAKLNGVPLILHEQNYIEGLANKILSKFANKVFTSFNKSFDNSKKIIWVGNPIRKEILDIAPVRERLLSHSKGKIHLLILGGSLGADILNKIVPRVLEKISKEGLDVIIWHQTGKGKLEQTKETYFKYKIKYFKLEEFIANMQEAYSFADLVICRGGATSIAEIVSIGLPGIVIPYPYAVDNHQFFNALAYAKKTDAITIIQQNNILTELYLKLRAILASNNAREKLIQKGENLQQYSSCRDPANYIANYCLKNYL